MRNEPKDEVVKKQEYLRNSGIRETIVNKRCFFNESQTKMRTKLKKIVSLTFLMVVLLQPIIKLEHNHKFDSIHLKNEKQSPAFERNCFICNLEFFVFIPNSENINLQVENLLISYINNYQTPSFLNHTLVTCSLRAPPENKL